ncbi:OmpA family protein [Seonamhaeicola algicola]|uniref:OmpA family protein n=1 Tax=Seonamhaeicola algicola TaxID=1719036 RepID=A0A5C7AUR7_9FLAO|nr:OmpA family protein [Seonamhaeicola algicola]TXE12087.1 OmpA family protein [Seonamhaeicola algicola]
MKITKNIFTIIALSIVLVGNAQSNRTIKKVTKEYEKFSYVKTTDVLLDIAEKGYESKDILQKLGNSYYFNNEMEDAVKWYSKLLNNYNDTEAEYLFRYAQALKSLKKYDEADEWMQKFVELRGNERRSEIFNNQKNYLADIDRLSEDFQLTNLPINTEVSDFGSNQYNGQLIFASSRGNGKKYKWNNQPYLNLYTSNKEENGTYVTAKLLNNSVNTKYHESSVAFMPKNDVMYFTRNNFFKHKLKRDEEGVNRLQIYRSKLNSNNKWDDIESIHFNSKEYSVAHPTINRFGTKMYFASDMPGTVGNSDLYMVDINEDGTLGTPVNLGVHINTESHETFPFINANGDLYFSSNGRNGLGGLDVYMVRDFEEKYTKKMPLTIENVGKPINSPMDDFGYYENLYTQEGFITSNREGGKGDDDIYSFTIPNCVQNLSGVVYDKKTNNILPNAKVILLNKSGDKISETIANDKGFYEFDDALKCNSEFLLRASKEKYQDNEQRFTSTNNRKASIEVDAYLDIDEVSITQGTNLREALSLNPIYFDLDKHYIRKDAEIELQKVISVMQKFPNLKIDVRSHTDSRATKAYNNKLSERRNKSTIQYIIEKGNITPERLTGKGYGESQLVNKCSDGVPCTEAEHQLNRRSDFIVIEQ